MSSFPASRLRRLRRGESLRALVRETTLSPGDLVQPLFVAPEALANDRLPAPDPSNARAELSVMAELIDRQRQQVGAIDDPHRVAGALAHPGAVDDRELTLLPEHVVEVAAQTPRGGAGVELDEAAVGDRRGQAVHVADVARPEESL